MKRKQIVALLLSSVIAVSSCLPVGVQAYAAEDANVSTEVETDSALEQATEADSGSTEVTDAADSGTTADNQGTEQDKTDDGTSSDINEGSDGQNGEAASTEIEASESEDSIQDDDMTDGNDDQEDGDSADAGEADNADTADTAGEIAEEINEEEAISKEAKSASDASDDIDKPASIAVNKEYTQYFERKNDIDCFKFKSGGGNFKVEVWYIPGEAPDPDDYFGDERIELSYATYGYVSAFAGEKPMYMWGDSETIDTTLDTPTSYETEGKDYTVSGDYVVRTIDLGNIKAGKDMGLLFRGYYKGAYKLKVIGKAYTVKKSIKKATVTVASGVYSGTAVKPKVTVKLGNTTLKNGTDYSVSYSNNIKVGSKAVAKITGKGKYKDTVSKTFTIKKRALTNKVNITLKNTSLSYSGKPKKPAFSIYLPATNNVGSIPLVKNTDYTFKYENNVEPGTGKLIVTGKGNFTGTAVRTFKINKLDQPATLNKTKITTTYDKIGTKVKLAVQGRKENAKITYSSSNTKVAVVKDGVVTIKGTGSAEIKVSLGGTKHYKGKTLKCTVNVLKKQTITTGIKDGAKIPYTTKAVPLNAVVKTGNGKLTYKSSDPSVAGVDKNGNLIFRNAEKLGTTTITITAATTSTYTKAVKTLKITTVKGKPELSCENTTQNHYYNEEPFSLGVSATEPVELTYQSDNPEYASVSDDGTVTLNAENINGNASVNITVKSKGTGFFKASDDLVVTLNIIVASINDGNVYDKQNSGSSNCTFYAAAHMMRRKAILDGRADWTLITREAIEDENSALARAIWNNGVGLKGTFSYKLAEDYYLNGECVEVGGLSVDSLASLLDGHPEGIEIYDTNLPHAVLVTGYDASSGTFYCYDSDPGQPDGFIPLSESLIGDNRGNSQDNVLASIGKYWYLH